MKDNENSKNLLSQMPEISLEKSFGGSFGQQFLSTLKLNALKRLRSPIGSFIEIFIPFFFIVGTVLLTLLIEDVKNTGEDFVNIPVMEKILFEQRSLLSSLCYDPVVNPKGVDGIKSCNEGTGKLYCGGNKSKIPLSGICIKTEQPPQKFAKSMALVFASYGTYMMPIPSFDDMVRMQWLAKRSEAVLGKAMITGSIGYSGRLYVTPRNAQTESMVAYLNQSSLFKYVFSNYFDTTKEADDFLSATDMSDGNWGVITLNKIATDPAKPFFDVVIRLNSSAVPDTDDSVNRLYNGGRSSHGADYILSGFLTLQTEVYNHFVNKLQLPKPKTPLVVPMGTVDYIKKTFLNAAGGILPLFVVLGFLFPVSQSTRRIVLDKELRIKEALLIMGLRQSAQYLAWFIFSFVQHAVVCVLIALLLKFTYVKNSSLLVMFFLFFFFSLSIVALSGLMAAFFSKSRLSSMISPLIFFILSAPLFAISQVNSAVVSALCVLSPSAFSQGIILLLNHEAASGFGSEQFVSPFDSPNMMFVFFMLILDTVLYLLLMLYLDAVVPNDWGTPRHPLFCILEPFSRCRKKRNVCSGKDGRNPNGVFEPLTEVEGSMAAVKICGLTKSFTRGNEKFFAVDHMYWNLVEGEISVLLGHNGAGKTTTMNMMTGMIKPDGGDCFIYGRSIREDLNGARQEIGFCPQHNILWPELTCYEHLEYFSSIKGLKGSVQKRSIENMLNSVDLQEKRNCFSSALSGGQKRKLSVAIAFVGNSRLIFLDEPTAGMDVGARRHTWELLRQMSADRTILLSTHFMDEADLLGDRIAIMSNGRMQCAGSSVFLKSNLGVGYNITFSVTNSADPQVIQRIIQSYVPPAEMLGCTAGEISFRLPLSFVKRFSGMLADIERSGKVYGVQHFTLSATTLEEIFLRITHGEITGISSVLTVQNEKTEETHDEKSSAVGVDTEHSSTRTEIGNTKANDSGASQPLNCVWDVQLLKKESAIVCSQIKASLKKRLLNGIRDRRTLVFQIIIPVIIIVCAMLLNMLDFVTHPSIVLSSNMYGENVDIDLANCHNTSKNLIPFARRATSVFHNDMEDASLLSGYYRYTYLTHNTSRYTGLVCEGSSSNEPAVLFFNFSALHASSVSVLGYYGAVVQKALSPSSVSYMEDIFPTSNYPMPYTKFQKAFLDMMKSLLMSILVMCPFLFVPSTYVSWVVKERECKARHLQNVSGLRFSVYWLSNYIFDMCSYLVTMCLVLVVLFAFKREEYTSEEAILPLLVLLITYGFSCIAMAYAFSFLFKEHSSAQNRVMLINFITGFFLQMLTVILTLIPATSDVGKNLKWGFRIFPGFCVGEGILNLAFAWSMQKLSVESSTWSLDVTGYPTIYMAVGTVIYLLITLILDHPTLRMRTNFLERWTKKPDLSLTEEEEEEDVALERQRVMQNDKNESQDLVQVVDLCKVYKGGIVAVRNLTFGVRPGEVFGFLGTNGAGKTTTISILCQEMAPTSGKAFICGKDVVKNSREALQYIGYCPQFDALLDLLTVKEHLELYSGIRGVELSERQRVVDELMKLCELTKYKRTRACDLSGGNKRKLSVAIALIGGPRVVFLDEPSAGMDPVARRGLWTAIQTISNSCSVVLTTHHLEEVEVLAHRVAIMVDGTLRCLGNKTHLKHKYGSGFEMTIRTNEEVSREKVDEFIFNNFPNAKLNEVRGQRYTYALPTTIPLSMAFGVLEAHRESVGIADYAVSQTSIEQVFLRVSEETD